MLGMQALCSAHRRLWALAGSWGKLLGACGEVARVSAAAAAASAPSTPRGVASCMVSRGASSMPAPGRGTWGCQHVDRVVQGAGTGALESLDALELRSIFFVDRYALYQYR